MITIDESVEKVRLKKDNLLSSGVILIIALVLVYGLLLTVGKEKDTLTFLKIEPVYEINSPEGIDISIIGAVYDKDGIDEDDRPYVLISFKVENNTDQILRPYEYRASVRGYFNSEQVGVEEDQIVFLQDLDPKTHQSVWDFSIRLPKVVDDIDRIMIEVKKVN